MLIQKNSPAASCEAPNAPNREICVVSLWSKTYKDKAETSELEDWLW